MGARKSYPKPTALVGCVGGPHPSDSIYNIVHCGNYDVVNGKRRYHHFDPEKTGGLCGCPAGSQKLAIPNRARELANLGGRAGMKTDAGLMIALRLFDEPDNANWVPYIQMENYTCLILRRTTKDLEDWQKRGARLFGKMGAEVITSPAPKFRWPSGAEFVLDHVQGTDAYQKYQGQEFQTIIWEEVTHCPNEKLYLDVIRSCRAPSDSPMKPRIYCTANPDGPGIGWVRERFWRLTVCGRCGWPEKVCGKRGPIYGKGRLAPLDKSTCERYVPVPARKGEVWYDPEAPLLSRACIHSTIYDNPFTQRFDPAYVQSLERLEGVERQRWLEGNFDTFQGQVFVSFRPDGPQGNEPAEARHVVQAGEVRLQDWWPRVIGMDIGFRHAASAVKACITPDGRLVIYDEKVENNVTVEEWGVRIALWCMGELERAPESRIELFLSHDAFHELGYDRTRAAALESGISRVLGPKAGFVIEQREGETLGEFFARYEQLTKTARIVIRQADRRRTDAVEQIRELMRFRQIAPVSMEAFDLEHAKEILESGDSKRYAGYLKKFEEQPREVLPKLLITNNCAWVVKALREAQYADKYSSDQKGEDVLKTTEVTDDVYDSVRYLAMGFQFKVEYEPREYWVQRQVQDAMVRQPGMSGADLFALKRHLNNRYGAENPNKLTPFTIRMGGPSQRGIFLK